MSRQKHRMRRDKLVQRRKEAPLYDSEPKEVVEGSLNARTMRINTILTQLADLEANSRSFLHNPPEDGDEVWLQDIEALEAATAILTVLQKEGINDPEELKDLFFDYTLGNKQLKAMTAKYERPTTPIRKESESLCPVCKQRLSSFARYCTNCGKRVAK